MGYWICKEYPEGRLYLPKDVISETMGDAIQEETKERLKDYVNEKYESDDAYAVLQQILLPDVSGAHVYLVFDDALYHCDLGIKE